MNTDLNEVFNAVFDGPLPAVDGFNLTRLDAESLEGTRLPDTFRIAYLDDLNAFTRGQSFINNDDEEPVFQIGFGNLTDPSLPITPTSYWRFGSLADGEFYVSQNASWDGAAWIQDDNAIDSLVCNFIDGDLSLFWWDSVLGDFRNTWALSGPEIFIANEADDASLSFALRDANDVIRLGESAAVDTTPAGYIAIPAKTNTQIPLDADADNDGIILIDKTNKYLVFYTGGLRYRVAGVAYP